ncbi:MAG: recombination protein RecR [Solobacterium sp.]|nr:recombination protein RecR [Erysipelotrichaceae bacterium]MBQ9153342.1 recombination protein RecR [Solobacterium sp.]
MYPASLQKLIESFRMLPGVGEKTAERYALLISEADETDVREFAQAMLDVREKLTHCRICGNLTESEECEICRNTDRNHRQILVVQSAKDVIAIERTGEYRGVYHVLNGLISTSKGIMPDDLNIDTLVRRASDCDEIILATSATMDGETTAMYLDRLLKDSNPDLLITRIAHGLPSGGMLDYADEITLMHALTDRRKMG